MSTLLLHGHQVSSARATKLATCETHLKSVSHVHHITSAYRRCVPLAAAGSYGNNRRQSKPDRKVKQPGLFEVKVMTPPPKSLGIFALPPNTHNGEEIEVDGEGYVVTSLVLHYKLVKGKYVREHNRLEVQPTGRYFLNMMLDDLIKAKYVGQTGTQD